MVTLGGKDTYDFIRRCFQETLSDSLMRNFTFEGTKEKKSFKDLKIGKMILGKLFYVNHKWNRDKKSVIRHIVVLIVYFISQWKHNFIVKLGSKLLKIIYYYKLILFENITFFNISIILTINHYHLIRNKRCYLFTLLFQKLGSWIWQI